MAAAIPWRTFGRAGGTGGTYAPSGLPAHTTGAPFAQVTVRPLFINKVRPPANRFECAGNLASCADRTAAHWRRYATCNDPVLIPSTFLSPPASPRFTNFRPSRYTG